MNHPPDTADASTNVEVILRDVVPGDLRSFFEHQSDPEACAQAAFKPRAEADFLAHWARILTDGTVAKQTVVYRGDVAGNMLAYDQGGKRLVGYWIATRYWGRGIASRALRLFLEHVTERPLHAYVATHNRSSLRVLEKCGFRIEPAGGVTLGSDGVEELELILREPRLPVQAGRLSTL